MLDRTPFYAESGGQVADAGTIVFDGGRLEVVDVQRPIKGLVVHQVRVLEGELDVSQLVHARVGCEIDLHRGHDRRIALADGLRRAGPGRGARAGLGA